MKQEEQKTSKFMKLKWMLKQALEEAHKQFSKHDIVIDVYKAGVQLEAIDLDCARCNPVQYGEIRNAITEVYLHKNWRARNAYVTTLEKAMEHFMNVESAAKKNGPALEPSEAELRMVLHALHLHTRYDLEVAEPAFQTKFGVSKRFIDQLVFSLKYQVDKKLKAPDALSVFS